MAYALLNHINQNSHKWKVLVRLPRVWEFRNPRDPADVYRLDFIMLDEQGNVMEGLIPQRWLHKFTSLLKEGSIYEIEYFEVLPAKEAYKAVDSNNLARFSKYTRVKEILPEPEGFPVYAYNAVPFSVLNDRIGKNTLLSDTVVLITAASQLMQTTTKLGSTVKRTIDITDGSQTAIITLWGQHAELFNAEMLLTVSQNTPVVALFVGMLVGTYSGQLALQSSSASKWYINIPIPEIHALQNTISNRPHQIQWQEGIHDHNNPISTTVPELLTLIPNEALGQRYKVSILITDLVPEQSWWYISCSSCWKKTFPHGDAYECKRCGTTTAEPRYKINVYGVDSEANEENRAIHAEFMFFAETEAMETGRKAEAEMREWCVALPKVELHAHLNGSVRDSTLLELAKQLGDKGVIVFEDVKDVIMKNGRSLPECFQLFDLYHILTTDHETVTRITKEVVEDFAAENVVYLEIRTTPKNNEAKGMTKQSYMNAVIKGLKAVEAVDVVLFDSNLRTDKLLTCVPMGELGGDTKKNKIYVRLLLSIDRREATSAALDTVNLAMEMKDLGIVGIDLSGNPVVGEWETYLPALERARELGLPITIHCGEVANRKEIQAVLDFCPQRVGHVCCLEGEEWKKLKSLMIPVEICLTSNVMTGGAPSLELHHFADFYNAKHPLSLCTDDAGLFSTSLSNEYYLVASTFGLSKVELFQLAQDAVEFVFAGEGVKKSLREVFKHAEKRLTM